MTVDEQRQWICNDLENGWQTMFMCVSVCVRIYVRVQWYIYVYVYVYNCTCVYLCAHVYMLGVARPLMRTTVAFPLHRRHQPQPQHHLQRQLCQRLHCPLLMTVTVASKPCICSFTSQRQIIEVYRGHFTNE